MRTEARKTPRFDLEFASGRCVVRARGPIGSGAIRFARLAMEGEVGASFDLRGGAERMRHRRTRLLTAETSVSFAALADLALGRRCRIRVEALGPSAIRCEFEDEAGVLVVEGALATAGADILFVPRAIRWLRAGPMSAWDRLVLFAQRLDIRFHIERGAFVFDRPLRRCLAQVLLPNGWRLPEERGANLAVTVGDDAFTLRTLDTQERGASDSPVPERQLLETQLQERQAQDAQVMEEARTLGATLRREDAPPWLKAATAPATTGLDAPTVAALWRELEKEPARWLRADGVLYAAERRWHGEAAQEEWAEQVLRALSCFPADMARHELWALRFAESGLEATLRLLEWSLGGPWSRAGRARLVAEVLVAYLEVADLPPLERVRALAERAHQDAPEMAVTTGALGTYWAEVGDDERAMALFLQAADFASGQKAGHWRALAADCAARIRGPVEARRMLEQALVESAGHPPILVTLALAAANEGDVARAGELFGRLLRGHQHGQPWEEALVAAARFYVERDESDKARPFMAKLGPVMTSFPPVAEISDLYPLGPMPVEEDEDEEVALADSVEDEPLDYVFESAEIRLVPLEEPEGGEGAPAPLLRGQMDLFGTHPEDGSFEEGAMLDDGGILDEAFPSQIFERPPFPAAHTGVLQGDGEERNPFGAMTSDEPSPEVTVVGATGDSLRALLSDVREADDPEALLAGALENAIEDDDELAVLDVLRVLDRIPVVGGERALRERVKRWRDQRGGPHGEPMKSSSDNPDDPDGNAH